MFLTNVYDLSKDYNMMLNNNIIDCFEEVPISQEVIDDIIKDYNLEQNEMNECSSKINKRTKKTRTVNDDLSIPPNDLDNYQDNGLSDSKPYTGLNKINSRQLKPLTPNKKWYGSGQGPNYKKEKLNKNEIQNTGKLFNGRIRIPNLSVENNGNSKDTTNRNIKKTQENHSRERRNTKCNK